jgi:hypothetical protein
VSDRRRDVASWSIFIGLLSGKSRPKSGDLPAEVEGPAIPSLEVERVSMDPFSPWLLSILMIIPVQMSEASEAGLL